MSPQERARRLASGLSQSQIQNLDRWGYPFVLSEFRFHMTLTGAVPQRRKKAILAVLLNGFHHMKVERSIAIDRLALMKQETTDAPFRVLDEAMLKIGRADAALGARRARFGNNCGRSFGWPAMVLGA